MKKVSDILSHEGKHITAVAPTTAVRDALKMMAEENIGSIIVMDGKKFLGIMTERDYARKVVLTGRSSAEVTVSEIMSTHFPVICPKDTLEFCMQQMSDLNLRYLPVFSAGRLIGIISINDVVSETISGHEEVITHLTDYLHANL
ncbi:CBS domain-containing protein [Paraflavisolibacter sp. H34]|uniref:CBS domain-containing protein n=1 Tax=Huijunlia imazamoxiresistens TaxID=3127457 RepID=UPI003018A13C